MDEWAAIHNPDFIISTGDNIYPDGVTSEDDVRFDDAWRDVYTGDNIVDLVWYISVGNHDHGDDDRELYQVVFGDNEPRWHFPALYYHETFLTPDGATLEIFCIDTQSMRHEKHEIEQQYEWLEDSLATSTADWKIVFGHHPALTTGWHGPGSGTIRDNVIPICEKYDVDILLTGHDHNLQHIVNITDPVFGMQHVISGGGARSLYDHNQGAENEIQRMGYRLEHFEADYGFVTFQVDADVIQVDYFTKDGDVGAPAYNFTYRKSTQTSH